MAIDKSNYNEYVKKKTPNSPLLKDCIKAFIIGGLICIIGQGITDIAVMLGAGTSDVKKITPIVLAFLGSFLTGIGVYDKLGKHAGGGSIIPITGFANSIVSSAMEFKKEGYVMGVGAKMFTIAGPVIVYGVIASMVYGLIYWLVNIVF